MFVQNAKCKFEVAPFHPYARYPFNYVSHIRELETKETRAAWNIFSELTLVVLRAIPVSRPMEQPAYSRRKKYRMHAPPRSGEIDLSRANVE